MGIEKITVEDYILDLKNEINNAEKSGDVIHINTARKKFNRYSFFAKLYALIYRRYYTIEENTPIEMLVETARPHRYYYDPKTYHRNANLTQTILVIYAYSSFSISLPKDAPDDILQNTSVWENLVQGDILQTLKRVRSPVVLPKEAFEMFEHNQFQFTLENYDKQGEIIWYGINHDTHPHKTVWTNNRQEIEIPPYSTFNSLPDAIVEM